VGRFQTRVRARGKGIAGSKLLDAFLLFPLLLFSLLLIALLLFSLLLIPFLLFALLLVPLLLIALLLFSLLLIPFLLFALLLVPLLLIALLLIALLAVTLLLLTGLGEPCLRRNHDQGQAEQKHGHRSGLPNCGCNYREKNGLMRHAFRHSRHLGVNGVALMKVSGSPCEEIAAAIGCISIWLA
jgi:hypothetical protein